ncbi:META domain-containing protein [Rhodohalobacter mucosus]|uniref:DUF306 domain-containing protein n=1 Tax=Rhodohalobacter mucosus TaxID=2079485 RepID=A0A316TSI4_9BACT|nr:META domain-containing protein [Rhodohalobacter mucosus]PWN06299.1 hypothetical protein DDZ15_10775 [Rhodohalobacter mucosus]
MRLPIVIVLMLFAVLTGCSTAANQSTIEKTGLPDQFFNTEWQLIGSSDTKLSQEATSAEEIPMLIFGLEENRIFGSGGCNRFSGAYLPGDDGTLTFGDIVATQMTCVNQASETAFFDRLNTVTHYQFNEDFTELSLLKPDGDVLLTFTKTRIKRI